MSTLPDPDEVFARFFIQWYEPEALAQRPYNGTRPDVERCYQAGIQAPDISPLTELGQVKVSERVAAMTEAARSDWRDSLGVCGGCNVEWINAFDQHYDRARVAQVLAGADPSDFANDVLVLCGEFGAILGEVLRTLAPRLEWLYEWPYWESAVLDPAHGVRINVFHWAIKKFSDYGVDDGFAEKVLRCVSLVEQGWSAPQVT